MRSWNRTIAVGVVACLSVKAAHSQTLTPEKVSGLPSERRSLTTLEDPAMGYSSGPFADPVAELSRRLASGPPLTFDPETGYLKSVLEALKLSAKSQLLVYSKTS